MVVARLNDDEEDEQAWQEVVARASESEDAQEECDLLESALFIQSRCLHELHREMYRTAGNALNLSLVLRRIPDAIRHCLHLIKFQRAAYGQNAYHPLLGLQLYTLGDLYTYEEKWSEAMLVLTEALEILRVTHGTQSEFVRGLAEMVEEAREKSPM